MLVWVVVFLVCWYAGVLVTIGVELTACYSAIAPRHTSSGLSFYPKQFKHWLQVCTLRKMHDDCTFQKAFYILKPMALKCRAVEKNGRCEQTVSPLPSIFQNRSCNSNGIICKGRVGSCVPVWCQPAYSMLEVQKEDNIQEPQGQRVPVGDGSVGEKQEPGLSQGIFLPCLCKWISLFLHPH